MKRVYVLILCILILFSGCWQNSDSDKIKHPNMESTLKPATYIQDGKLVKKSTRAKYLVENDIDINYEYINDAKISSQCDIQCPYIIGIKDEKIRTKINNEMKSILKYKIFSILNDHPDATISVGNYTGINVNNLFSHKIAIQVFYPQNIIKNYQINLNYNLKNGEKIRLKDIFTDGTDYVSLLNEKITEKVLKENIEEEILRRPFEGIDPEQGFFLGLEQLEVFFSEEDGLLAYEGSLDIPYYEIDDYMDIFDKYPSQGENLYFPNLYLRKKNNLRIKNECKRIEDEKIVLEIRYPKIMVSENQSFADDFNKFMEKHVSEILNKKDFTQKQNSYSIDGKPFISIQVNEVFNKYGVLCFVEVGLDNSKIYLYDLNTGKQFDLKKLISQNKELSGKVMAVAKESATVNGIDEKEMSSELLFKKTSVYPTDDYLFIGYEKNNKNESKYVDLSVSYASMSETPESFFEKLGF